MEEGDLTRLCQEAYEYICKFADENNFCDSDMITLFTALFIRSTVCAGVSPDEFEEILKKVVVIQKQDYIEMKEFLGNHEKQSEV